MQRSISVGVPVFNRVCIPLFILMLFLTAIGPGLAWVKTSKERIVANLLGPAAASIVLAAASQWFVWTRIRGGDQGEVFPFAQQIYPTFLVVFLAWLIITSLAWELVRTVLNAAKGSGRDPVSAFVRLVTFQNRRYGGYLVHVGLATLAMGVMFSSGYRVTTEVAIAGRDSARVGPYEVREGDIFKQPATQGQTYDSIRVPVTVFRDGVEVAALHPEKRDYRVNRHRVEPQVTTEVEIARRSLEDFYVYFDHQQQDDRLKFTFFRSPCMWLVWIGWITMLVGGGFAALPLGGKKVGLA
jgi:cytochrome c-type biogenesis protein CcmF